MTAEFAQRKRELMQRYGRGFGADVAGLHIDLGFLLDTSPLLGVVRVKKPGDGPYLITATCRPKVAKATPEQLARELERLWVNEIWNPALGTEAHGVSISTDSVTLEFIALRGYRYILGLLVVDLRPQSPRKRSKT